MTTPPITDYAKLALQRAILPAPPPQMAMPGAMPSMNAPAPLVARLPTQTEMDTAKLDHTINSGSGIDQIQNGLLRGVARTGNVFGTVASALLPALRPVLSAIPGTTEHHNLLVHQQRANVQNDQAQDLGAARTDDANAQADQRRALATQEEAKAQALLNPQAKAQPAHLLTSPDGTAPGWVDGDGNIRALDDPQTPDGIRKVAGLMAPKPEKVAAADKPIEQEEADAHNAIYKDILVKHNLPTGQFKPGMTRAEVQSTMNNLNTVLAKQQGDQRIVVQVNGQQQRAQNASPLGNQTTSGDAFLSSLPPALQSTIKATAAGDIAMPPPGTRNPQALAIREAVMNYDPTYTDARYKGKQQFKNSGDADKIVQLSTALEHGHLLQQNSDKLGFSPGISMGIGPTATAYNEDVNHYTDEVGRLIKNGVVTEGEGRTNRAGLLSPTHESRAAAIQEKNELLAGKVQALLQKYRTSTGEDLPVDKFFDKGTQGRLQRLGIDGAGNAGNGAEEWVRDSNGKLVKK